MKRDPLASLKVTTITRPRSHGPGSGKAAWVAYATELAIANPTLFALIEEQSATIKDL